MQQPKLTQSKVFFNEEEHRYFAPNGKELNGITSTIIKWMFPNTYANIPPAVLANAAKHGHEVHKCIELADVVGATPECPESQQYLDMMQAHGMTAIEHEYLVSDNSYFASSIDLVLQDAEGGIWLADIKTTSALLEPKVRLQLSIYAMLFEQQNPDIKVQGIVEVWLPKSGKAKYVVLPRTSCEDVQRTIDAYHIGECADDYLSLYCDSTAEQLPPQYNEIAAAIAECEQTAKAAIEESKRMKAILLEAFHEYNSNKIEIKDVILITKVEATTRKSVDSKRLQADYPEAYANCLKESKVSESIKITLR